MTVIVHSKTMKLTRAIRAAVAHQVERIRRRFPQISQVRVFLEKIARKKNDALASQAEFLVSLPGKDVVVTKSAPDLYQAIHDGARTTLLQVQKLKERRQNRSLPS